MRNLLEYATAQNFTTNRSTSVFEDNFHNFRASKLDGPDSLKNNNFLVSESKSNGNWENQPCAKISTAKKCGYQKAVVLCDGTLSESCDFNVIRRLFSRVCIN